MADKRTGDFDILNSAQDTDLVLVTSDEETYNMPVSVLKNAVAGSAAAAAASAAAATQASQAAQAAAEASLNRQPRLSDDNTWEVWDPTLQQYVDTHVRAEASSSWLYVEIEEGELYMVIVDEDEDGGIRFIINNDGELEVLYEWQTS